MNGEFEYEPPALMFSQESVEVELPAGETAQRELYIGTELGISFKTGKEKNGYYTQTRGEKSYQGAEIKTDWTENYSSQTGIKNYLDNINKTVTTTVEAVTDHSATTTRLKVYVEPAIRIGWLF